MHYGPRPRRPARPGTPSLVHSTVMSIVQQCLTHAKRETRTESPKTSFSPATCRFLSLVARSPSHVAVCHSPRARLALPLTIPPRMQSPRPASWGKRTDNLAIAPRRLSRASHSVPGVADRQPLPRQCVCRRHDVSHPAIRLRRSFAPRIHSPPCVRGRLSFLLVAAAAHVRNPCSPPRTSDVPSPAMRRVGGSSSCLRGQRSREEGCEA